VFEINSEIFFQEMLSKVSLYEELELLVLETISNLETAEIDASASHLNQKVITL
jgi:hypothetical protein